MARSQRLRLLAGDPARRAARRDARAEQSLARVDVAHADHDLRIHDEMLDGDRALAGGAVEVLRVEVLAQGLGRELGEQRMQQRIARRPDAGCRNGEDRESAAPAPSRARGPSDRGFAAERPPTAGAGFPTCRGARSRCRNRSRSGCIWRAGRRGARSGCAPRTRNSCRSASADGARARRRRSRAARGARARCRGGWFLLQEARAGARPLGPEPT